MKLKRYYYNGELKQGNIVVLEGDEFHHLKNVMRTNVGDLVSLFNGTKIDAIAQVKNISKNKAELYIQEILENNSEPAIEVTLFQAVCKGDKLSLITQKITELGATNMTVFYSQYTDIKDKTSKLDKLERVSISASKQCGRSSILNVEGVVSFAEMLNKAKVLDKVFVAYENADQTSLYDSLSKNANYKKIGVIIGAEGGFSEKEIEIINENKFEIVTLGKRILRTETAAIASVAQIMFACE